MSQLLNILVAYPYMSKDIIQILQENKNDIRFVLDSGAFTAWKAGKEIKLDDYCNFIDSLPFEPWRYFSLDVIGNPKKSMENYEVMLKRGFTPVPIFTRGEDPKILDEYYKTSDVVGIGGLVGTKGNKGFVKGIMKYVGSRKVHWLGFTNFDYVRYYKPYMCDSSSWEMGARYANFILYLGNGKRIRISKKDFIKKPNKEIEKRLNKYGYSAKDLTIVKNWHGGRSINRILNAFSIADYTKDLEKNIGTKQFSAASSSLAVGLLIDTKDKIK